MPPPPTGIFAKAPVVAKMPPPPPPVAAMPAPPPPVDVNADLTGYQIFVLAD